MEEVLPNVADASMQTGQAQGRLLPVAGAFLFPAVPPLAATQNAKIVLQWFWSLNLYHLAVFRNDGGKVAESNVDSAGRAFHWSRVWYFFHHRQAYKPAVSLTAYRRRQAGVWYACFSVEVDPAVLPSSDKAVGVDLGLEFFATTSDGEFFPSAKYLRKSERKLKQLQRMVSRRQKGSHRRKKAVRQLAKAHAHVANQRRDMAHKIARSLVNRYGRIAVEDLNVKGMLKNHHLAKSISDAGWGLFVRILKAKAAEAGRQVVEVDPRNTSQICSGCGCIVEKPLSQRWHKCPHCGTSLHRDVNAAINILHRAVA